MKLKIDCNNTQYLGILDEAVWTLSLSCPKAIEHHILKDDENMAESLIVEPPQGVYVVPTIIGGPKVLNIYRSHDKDEGIQYTIDCKGRIEEFAYTLQLLKTSLLIQDNDITKRLSYDWQTSTFKGYVSSTYTVALTVHRFADEPKMITAEHLDDYNIKALSEYIEKLVDNNMYTFGNKNDTNEYDEDNKVVPYDVRYILCKYFGIPIYI